MIERRSAFRRAASCPQALCAAALLVGAGLMAACTQNPTMTQHELLNEEQYAQYRQPGTSEIDGQVVIQLPSGQKLYGANCEVRLLPVTDESTKYIQNVVLPGKVEKPKQGLESVSWVAQADDLGRFQFRELPAGNYYLTCPLAWRQNGETREGIAFTQAQIGAGEKIQVEVTRGTGGSGG